jgi:hypothetical protein
MAGFANNTVYLENQSSQAWRMEILPPAQETAGDSTAVPNELIVNKQDPVTLEYVEQAPGADGSFVIPSQARIALGTRAPMATPDQGSGFLRPIRLYDEGHQGGASPALNYSVAWYFYAPSPGSFCQFRKRIQVDPGGPAAERIIAKVSDTEVRIIAGAWPAPDPVELERPALPRNQGASRKSIP